MINDTLQDVFDHFDRLNQDEGHFQNSNDICTPMECVKEMVDTVPSSLWRREGLKVLDSCCGNGNFHAYIQTKTDLKNLYFNEINEKRICNILDYFGDNINLTRRDFLEFGVAGDLFDRGVHTEFDLVVSNPPYAQFCGDTRASKNHNMSRAFIKKALDITKPNGYVLFIAPDNWMSFSDRNILPSLMSRYQFLHLNIHGAKKYFPKVGSSFTWFLLKKTANKMPFVIENHYKKRDRVRAKLERGIDFIPLYYSDEIRKLIGETIYADVPKYEVETTSDLHKTTKKHLISPLKDSKHPYRLIHTPKQTVYSSRPHKYQDGWKVFLSLSDRYGTFVDDCGMTQSIAFIRCGSRREADTIKRELDSPVYRALNNLTRYGNFNNIRILQRFPRLEHVCLTKRQEKLINHFAEVL